MVTPTEQISRTSLEREVLHVTNETSDKFVPAPDRNLVLSDLLIGLKRFRNVVRWKYFFAEKKRVEEESKDSPLSQNAFNSRFSFNEIENEEKAKNNQSLNSGLKAANTTQNAPIGSPETESFLKELERIIITQAAEEKIPKKERDEIIYHTLIDLKKSNEVVIATDKTNSYRLVPIEKYKKWVLGHLQTSAKRIERERISEIFELANTTCDKFQDILDDKETIFLKSTLKTKNIPTPKLIIKDHKDPDEEGDYPNRLIVPANNFTSAFPRLGYLGIKRIFDANNIEYEKRTISQASNLKEEIEKLDIKRKEVTVCKLDIVNMYPSIQFKIVKKL